MKKATDKQQYTPNFTIKVSQSKDKLSTTNIEIHEPLVGDFLELEKYETPTAKSIALISMLCTFDGKQLTIEEVSKMPFNDFLYLQSELMSRGLMGSEELLSSLSERAGLPTQI